jgi:uncharacterized protein (DUF983 family)
VKDKLLLLGRGFMKRCPRCGSGGLFTTWTKMVDACPRCGMRFEREEGYWVGAMTVNIVVTEIWFVIFLVVGIVLTWPELPVLPLVGIGVVVNGLFPVFFYPFSKTVWLAIDLAFFHPARPLRGNRSGPESPV